MNQLILSVVVAVVLTAAAAAVLRSHPPSTGHMTKSSCQRQHAPAPGL